MSYLNKRIKKALKEKNDTRRVGFRQAQADSIVESKASAIRNNASNAYHSPGFGGADLGGSLRLASRLFVPAAIMATAMEVGLKPLEYAYNKTILQDNIKNALDMVVSEAPMLAQFAVFGTVDAMVSKRIGSGTARGTIGKILGGGGGIKGKAIGFTAGMIAATLSSSIFSPIQQSLGNAIASERSLGLESAISKGSQSQIDAAIRMMAKEKGVDNITMAKSLNLRGDGVRGMTTRQMIDAERQNNKGIYKGGFFSALASGNVIKWSEQTDVEKANQSMRVEKSDRKVALLDQIHNNNKMIIDFYSRE